MAKPCIWQGNTLGETSIWNSCFVSDKKLCPKKESGKPIHFEFRTPLVLVVFSLLMLLALALVAVGKFIFWVSQKF